MRKDGGQKTVRDVNIKYYLLQVLDVCHMNQLPTESPNVFTTPLQQWGVRQCLSFSWTTLSGRHCPHPFALMGVVDMFGPCLRLKHSIGYLLYRA